VRSEAINKTLALHYTHKTNLGAVAEPAFFSWENQTNEIILIEIKFKHYIKEKVSNEILYRFFDK
jgi:hypothetical protein